MEENQYIKMGAYHTIDLELNRKFTIFKEHWDSVTLERIDTACDPAAVSILCLFCVGVGGCSEMDKLVTVLRFNSNLHAIELQLHHSDRVILLLNVTEKAHSPLG